MNHKTELSRLATEVVRVQNATLATKSSLGRVKARLNAGVAPRRTRASLWLIAGAALSASTVWALVAPSRPKTIAKAVAPAAVSIDESPSAVVPQLPPPERVAPSVPVTEQPLRVSRPRAPEIKVHHAQTAAPNVRVPKTADALLDAADRARADGASAAAVDALTEFVSRFPNDPRLAVAWFTLGRVRATLGRHAEAAAAYAACSTASRAGPLREDADAATALAWANAGNLPRAREAAAHYLRLYPHGAFQGRLAPLLQH